jgi:hypothetical protein
MGGDHGPDDRGGHASRARAARRVAGRRGGHRRRRGRPFALWIVSAGRGAGSCPSAARAERDVGRGSVAASSLAKGHASDRGKRQRRTDRGRGWIAGGRCREQRARAGLQAPAPALQEAGGDRRCYAERSPRGVPWGRSRSTRRGRPARSRCPSSCFCRGDGRTGSSGRRR